MAQEVTLTISGMSESGTCSLSGKEGVQVINVKFEDGTAEGNLSFKAFQSLLRMKLTQKNGVAKSMPPTPPPATSSIPSATLAAPK